MQTVERKKKPSLDPVFTQVEWELLSTLEISRVLEEFLDLQALAAVTEARDRARDSVAVRASLSTFRPAPMASVLLTLLARLQTSILSLLALTDLGVPPYQAARPAVRLPVSRVVQAEEDRALRLPARPPASVFRDLEPVLEPPAVLQIARVSHRL
jgi:hypothetical protein